MNCGAGGYVCVARGVAHVCVCVCGGERGTHPGSVGRNLGKNVKFGQAKQTCKTTRGARMGKPAQESFW